MCTYTHTGNGSSDTDAYEPTIQFDIRKNTLMDYIATHLICVGVNRPFV